MKQKVSLVLSGGGARGIAHIGVIEELEKRDYEIVSVTGTSMGSLIGGIYALGKLEELKDWLFTLDKLKVFNLVDFTFSSQGLVKGDKVLNTIKEFIPDDLIENLKIPFAAVAVDLLNKKEVVFRKGSIYEAIRASIAIPTVFTPVNAENSLLVDGGVLNNIPVNYAQRIPGDILIAVNVNADIPVYRPPLSQKEDETKESIYWKKIRDFQSYIEKIVPLGGSGSSDRFGYFDLINRTLDLMSGFIVQTIIEKNPPDMLIEVSKDSCGTFDFYKAEEMYEIGRHAAQTFFESQK